MREWENHAPEGSELGEEEEEDMSARTHIHEEGRGENKREK